MSATLDNVTIEIVPDQDADTSYLEQDEFANRLAEYRRDEFYFVGIRLVAEIAIPDGLGSIMQTITSPGLWSVESDSGEDYFRSVATDEAETLREMLSELNVTGTFEPTTIPLVYR
jgi:hypothetical protein